MRRVPVSTLSTLSVPYIFFIKRYIIPFSIPPDTTKISVMLSIIGGGSANNRQIPTVAFPPNWIINSKTYMDNLRARRLDLTVDWPCNVDLILRLVLATWNHVTMYIVVIKKNAIQMTKKYTVNSNISWTTQLKENKPIVN